MTGTMSLELDVQSIALGDILTFTRGDKTVVLECTSVAFDNPPKSVRVENGEFIANEDIDPGDAVYMGSRDGVSVEIQAKPCLDCTDGKVTLLNSVEDCGTCDGSGMLLGHSEAILGTIKLDGPVIGL